MRIAVVGSGISGLVSAYLLSSEHDVTVFEANDYIGGHTHTLDVHWQGERHAIDTGFIVCNDRTYPNFLKLLDHLDVARKPTSMSFSVRCDRTNLEYNGTSLNTLFAQRRNLFRPRFYRMLKDILRFNRECLELLEDPNEAVSVGEYLTRHKYSREFIGQYLVPMGAAIWSCPPGTFEMFPMRFIVEFYHNHGLLSLKNRPQWYVIQGGSWCYVDKLTETFRENIRLSCPVSFVRRHPGHVELVTAGGAREKFDQVIFACHSDQAMGLLADPSRTERELLGAFPYQQNIAVLHTDPGVLPKTKKAWASWNYHLPQDETQAATVTYNMNILQSLKSRHVFNVTLNETDRIDPKRIIETMTYHHPIYTVGRAAAQARHQELIRQNRTSFCGAYWGNGFHEDGVNSALAVCQAFGVTLDDVIERQTQMRRAA
jgi:predicted NAD/FAD-binding protein